MVNPMNLETVRVHMCYEKFSHAQLIEKEIEIRQSCEYIAERAEMIDFSSLFIKMIKYEFWKY